MWVLSLPVILFIILIVNFIFSVLQNFTLIISFIHLFCPLMHV